MVKRSLTLLFILSFSFLLFASDFSPAEEDYFFLSDIPVTYGDEQFRERILERTGGKRDPIGLVLTGGSARALAHIGVLSYLEEAGIVPDFIISNSMGSIIALLYAAGLEPEQITDFLRIGDLSNYFSLTLPLHGGILDPSGFKSLVESIVGPDLRLEDLQIPVMVISDDLVTKREIRITEGNFSDILIASFALPFYFSPQQYKGHLLIDGGVKSLVPIYAAYDYSDTVIISTTFYDLDTINLLNPITIINGSFDVGKRQRAASDMKKYSSYIWIRCNVEQFSFMDFSSADEMAAIGYESAKSVSDELNSLYKSGGDEFDEVRTLYTSSLEKARRNIYYFDRVESMDLSNNIMFAMKNYEGDDGYLNESLSLGLEYRLRYRMLELNTLMGYAFNSHSGYFDRNGLALDASLRVYPVQRLCFSLSANAAWYGFTSWVPSIYVKQALDLRLLVVPSLMSLSLHQGFEYFRDQDSMRGSIYMFDTSLVSSFESSIYKMKANIGYQISERGFNKEFRQFVNFNMDNRFMMPYSLFVDFSAFARFSIDGKKDIPIFSLDGFESNSIDPSFGYLGVGKGIAWMLSTAVGYALPVSPTVAEFLIFEDTELSAYFDSLMLDLDFYFSTGAQIQTKLSLIGLVDLPLRLRLGYDSLSGRFVGSMLFSTSF